MKQDELTLYVDGCSWLHNIHPLTKLTYILFVGGVVYTAPGGWVPAVVILLLNLTTGLLCGLYRSIWKFTWRMLLPLAVFMFPIHGLLFPDNHTPLFSLHAVIMYKEGVEFAIAILLQLATVLTASLLFVFSTHPAVFITSLTQAGNPPFVAYLIGGPLLMLPAMRDRIRTIQAAQRSRGLDIDGSLMKRIRSIHPLITPLVLSAFSEIEQRAVTLELKGFSLPGKKTSLRVVTDSTLQRILRWLMLFAFFGLVMRKILL